MSLDIAREYVLKFGSSLEENGEPLLKICLNLLNEPRTLTRKKAISCIGIFLTHSKE